MQEAKHVSQYHTRSMEPHQLAAYSAKLFPTALRVLATAIDNNGSTGQFRVFNMSIPVALYTEFVERVSQCRQELTIVDVCFAGQIQRFSKAAIQ